MVPPGDGAGSDRGDGRSAEFSITLPRPDGREGCPLLLPSPGWREAAGPARARGRHARRAPAGRARPRAARRPHLARPRGGAPRRLAAARRRRVHRPGQLRPRRRRPAGGRSPTPSRTVARWYADRGLRPRAQVPVPGAEAADAAFAAAGWTRDDDVLVLTAPLDGLAGPGRPGRPRPAPDDAWLTGYRYRGTPLPAGGRATCWSTPTTRCSPRSGRDPRPRRSAAVARGVAGRRLAGASPRSPSPRSTAGAGWPRAVMAALGAVGRRARRALLPAAGEPSDNAAGAGALRAAGLHRAPPLPLPAGCGPAPRLTAAAAGCRAPGRPRTPPRARRSSRNARPTTPVAPPPMSTRSPSGRRTIAAERDHQPGHAPAARRPAREPDSRSASRHSSRLPTTAASDRQRHQHAAPPAAAARTPRPAPARPRDDDGDGTAASRPRERAAAITHGPGRRTGRPPSRAGRCRPARARRAPAGSTPPQVRDGVAAAAGPCCGLSRTVAVHL